jgi:hypothetical protein
MTALNLESKAQQRLSVPPRRRQPPRAITPDELEAILCIADCLIPAVGENPKASDAEDYVSYLNLALAARSDEFDRVMAGVAVLSPTGRDDMWSALKRMSADDPETFDPLSAVVAGAYFMTPQVKSLIGYPGQHRDTAPLTQAADELGDGLLDPVLERGYIYVSAAGE